ncbi:hypothetical protein MXB_2339 [Myxobolus squamalis]|nr:hypothetical protein MXB_2339 [Myxobolus squamalis]
MSIEKAENEITDSKSDLEDPSDSFKVPEEKSVEELLNADQDDEALNKYKATLLGNTEAASKELRFRIEKIELAVDNCEPIADEVNKEILMGSKDLVVDIKSEHNIKEGSSYTSTIYLNLQIESGLLYGLKCLQQVYRSGIKIYVVGSFSANQKSTAYRVCKEVAPMGFLGRGSYKIINTFQDDDKKMKFTIISRLNITNNA